MAKETAAGLDFSGGKGVSAPAMFSSKAAEAAAALADKLGCREASFRTAGGTQPFGMAKSLDGTPLPQRAYLGPAFE